MRRTIFALLLLATASPAAAQSLADYDYENLGLRGAGAALGYMWSNRVQNTNVYSLRLDLGYLGPGVRIIPTLSYWQSKFTQKELDALAARINGRGGVSFVDARELAPLKWSDLSLSVDGQFVWKTPAALLTYVGAGFGLHALNGQGAAIDNTFIEDLLDSVTAGMSVLGGLELVPDPRLRFYGEGRYTVMNSIQYLSAAGGVQFMFGSPEPQGGTARPAPAPEGQ